MASFGSVTQFAIASSTSTESFVLSVNSGTYAISLHGAAKLITDIYPSGSYLLNGRTVGLNIGNIITAENASYTLTGTDAETETRNNAANVLLDRNYGIVADSGTFTATMTDADLMKGFGIGAGSNAYTVTYNDINANVSFAAPTGSFLMFGQPAFKGIGEGFEAGSFTVTTQDASFIYGRAVYPVSHKYTMTGNDITIRGFLSPVTTAKTYVESAPSITEVWTEQSPSGTTTWTEAA